MGVIPIFSNVPDDFLDNGSNRHALLFTNGQYNIHELRFSGRLTSIGSS